MAVINAIFYPATNTGYVFGTDDYSANGILKHVSQRRAMNLTADSLTEQGDVSNRGLKTWDREYNYPGSPTSCTLLDTFSGKCVAEGVAIATPTKLPIYSTMVESWSDMDSKRAPTKYAPTGQGMQITHPDGGRYVLTTGNNGLASHTERYDAGNKLLRKSTLLWEKGWLGSNRVKRIETRDELNQMTAQVFSYGATKNEIVDTWEYDYGGTNLLRRVHTDYVVEPSYAQQHIFSLPEAIEVYEGKVYEGISSLASRTEYLYDTEPLVDTPGVVHHSAAYNPFAAPIFHPGQCKMFCPGKQDIDCTEQCTEDEWEVVYDPATRFRGNLTQIKRYARAANRSGPMTEVRQHDIAGNVGQ